MKLLKRVCLLPGYAGLSNVVFSFKPSYTCSISMVF